MLRFYMPFALLGSLITILSTPAFCSDIDFLQDEYNQSNGHIKFLFSNSDGLNELSSYDLEEIHQELFKKQEFTDAARALVGSAIKGDIENMNYLLTIEPKAPEFIYGKNMDNIEKIISRISEDLAKQFKITQSEPKPLKLPLTSNYTEEALSKKQ